MDELLELVKEFDKRFTSGNDVDVDEHVKVPTSEWREIKEKLMTLVKNK